MIYVSVVEIVENESITPFRPKVSRGFCSFDFIVGRYARRRLSRGSDVPIYNWLLYVFDRQNTRRDDVMRRRACIVLDRTSEKK